MARCAALLLLALAGPALAHMEMSWPYPLHSKFNPDTPEEIKGESEYTAAMPP